MKFRLACFIVFLFMTLPLSGFVCATRVERMEADIEALQLQFNEVQKRLNKDQTQLTEMILRADSKLEELGSTQNASHDQVAQQNVQLALELERERAEMAAMRGRLDVQQRTIEELQSSLVTVMGSVASSSGGNSLLLPSDQEGLASFILERKASQDVSAQKAGIVEFMKRYPTDSRVEPMLAEYASLLSKEGSHREAISYATKYLQAFPKGSSRDAIIYIMGDSGEKIGNCELAVKSFQTLEALKYQDASERHKSAKAHCKK